MRGRIELTAHDQIRLSSSEIIASILLHGIRKRGSD